MTPQQFARRVRADLYARRWLRVHCGLIGLLTLLAAWAASAALMHAGTQALALRYGVAFTVAYGVLLALLYLWAHWLLSRDEADGPQIDGGSGGGSGGGGGGDRLPTRSFESGEGGDFGGAGAGGSFDAPELPSAAAESAGEAAGSALDVAGAADEGIVVLVPLALVIGVALLLGTALGFVVFGLFGVEVLLAVAVEIAIASAWGALAFKAGAEGWLSAAWRRTRGAALAGLVVVVAIGASIDHWLPEARSLPHALHLLKAV